MLSFAKVSENHYVIKIQSDKIVIKSYLTLWRLKAICNVYKFYPLYIHSASHREYSVFPL